MLKRFDGLGLSLRRGAEKCEINESFATELFGKFVSKGYLKKNGEVGEETWCATDKAASLFDKPTKGTVKRTIAEKKLEVLLERVRLLNGDPYYLYRVSRVAVFGSYLSDKNLLGDIDVGVELVPRELDRDRGHLFREARVNRARFEGQQFSNITEQVMYPLTECYRFLKARSVKLNLTYFSVVEERGFDFNLIYDSDGEDFVPSPDNPETVRPYLFGARLRIELAALCCSSVGGVDFIEGDRILISTKRPWSPSWEVVSKAGDEWLSTSDVFTPQRMSTAEVLELAESVYLHGRLIFHCRLGEAQEYLKSETCKHCGAKSWTIQMWVCPALDCDECGGVVLFNWKAPRAVRL